MLADEVPRYTKSVKGYNPARKPSAQLSVTCNRSVRRSRWQLCWPGSVIQYDKHQQHEDSCPWFWLCPARWTLGIQFLLPGLLARSLRATISATHGAGGTALSPTLISVNIVNRRASPAFRTIDTARDELLETLHYPKIYDDDWTLVRPKPLDISRQQRLLAVSAILERVQRELQSSFCAGQASPSDQDTRGFTLLHVCGAQPNTNAGLTDELGFCFSSFHGV